MKQDSLVRVKIIPAPFWPRPCGRFDTSAKMSGMAAPRITLRCDCGAEALVAYGERWTCGSCGRTYDTAGIPEADFEAIQALRRRYRIIGYIGMVLIGALFLLLALTAQEFQLFIGLPAILLVWFMYVRPFMRSRYRRRVGELQRKWTLHAEGEA